MDENEPKVEKTKEETDRKCPACGGVMDFDPSTGGLTCPYCGHQEEIKVGKKVQPTGKNAKDDDEANWPEETTVKEQDFNLAETKENCDWGVSKKTISCKSCGAVSVYDENQLANSCPYCGSNQVMEEKGKNQLAPGGVCPFAIKAEQAEENFKKWRKNQFWAPNIVQKKARADSFTGVYIPYWTFDTKTFSKYTAQYGIDIEETDSEGNKKTHTDWYDTRGRYKEFINDFPVCATNRYKKELLKQILPFNTEKSKPYKPEYVAGFIAERYTVGLKDGWKEGQDGIAEHLKEKIEKIIREEEDADHVRNLKVNTAYEDLKYKYLLLPVWLSSFKHNGKIYNFMVNGETGKVGGECPVSGWKVAIAIVIGLILLWLFFSFLGN
ncbi:TFIIB-type zinc ribbon-containing protein [bacterium]|nr:TFIIB-type zinc ribbon-containing protein [bacterium]